MGYMATHPFKGAAISSCFVLFGFLSEPLWSLSGLVIQRGPTLYKNLGTVQCKTPGPRLAFLRALSGSGHRCLINEPSIFILRAQ